MGLFGGGGSKSTSYITRPAYIQNAINSLSQQVKSNEIGDFTAQQFAGLNSQQQQALASMLNSEQMNQWADQIYGSGQSGISQLDDVYNQLNNEQGITQGDIERLATQLYDATGTEELVTRQNEALAAQQATDVNPNVAQQIYSGQAGFGSSQRLMKDRAAADLATSQQNAADTITSQAEQNARSQAESILSGNLSQRRNLLGALANNAQGQIGLVNTGAQMSQQAYQNQLNAIQQQQQNAQAQANMNYQNQALARDWKNYGYQQQLQQAGALSDLYGQRVTTTQSGGNSMLGGILSTAGAVVGGIYGGKTLVYVLPLRVIAMFKNFSNCWKLSLGYKYAF